jgi:uncharacterized protein
VINAEHSVSDARLAPVSTSDRVEALDVLRGIALLGILVVNILDYAPSPASTADRVVTALINLFAAGSFYPLFSLLFGVGFAVFLERATVRGVSGVWPYLRRLGGLLLIGVLQIVLLEDRNILVRYAFLAVPLLLFWRASARACLVAGAVCLALTVARGPINRMLVERQLRDPVAAAAFGDARAREQTEREARLAAGRQAAATRSYTAVAAYRARWQVPQQLRWSADLRRNPSLFHILAMFLFGAAAWRSRLLVDKARLPQRLLRLVVISAGVGGIVGNVVLIAGPQGDTLPPFAGHPTLVTLVSVLCNTALTLTYAGAIVLVMSSGHDAWRRRLAALAVIGRMGLTNYLMQSVAMSLIFLPYGLRLESSLPLWAYPLIGLVIFASHFPVSVWWLGRYRFGPVEWVWRLATYGRVQSMRLRRDPVPTAGTPQPSRPAA